MGLPSENNNNQRRVNTPKVTRPIRPKSPRPHSPSPVSAPVVHTKGKDRRKEKVTPTPVPEPELEKELPKSKIVITSSKPNEVERQDTHDNNARKSGKHLRTRGARLRRRWTEITGEECDLPKTLKECQRLHNDLLQADDESFENNEDQRAEDPEAGPGPTTQANRKKERKIVVPITAVDIHFEECPVEENSAYAFNVPVFGHEYAEASYIPQLISASQPKIKEVLQTELHKKDQIKSAIVVKCLYLLTKKDKEEREDSDDFANKVYKVKYHRGEMRPILLEEDIDEYITLTVGEIDKQVEEALLKGSGYTLERIEEISIEAYTLN
ncbi:hypothetical protein GLOIN_2v1481003 [Rhizophagus clarus]|uniref:Uncharacterized protein n=1 Tax=Rhizophagus clarus TaxID=94130 RepID=A0A8H3QR92_9GLOM|nr:hypothetical protein GLOIN_2v1481003 [Rhizophagus clarus]